MLWEPILATVAGALLSGGRVRVAGVDLLTAQQSSRPLTNFAGLVQWQMAESVASPFIVTWPRWGIALVIGGLLAALAHLLSRRGGAKTHGRRSR